MKNMEKYVNIMNYEENEEEMMDYRGIVEKIYERELQDGLRRINEVYSRAGRR